MPGVTSVLVAAAALGGGLGAGQGRVRVGSEPLSLLGARLIVGRGRAQPFAAVSGGPGHPVTGRGPGSRRASPGSHSRAPAWASSRRSRAPRRRRSCCSSSSRRRGSRSARRLLGAERLGRPGRGARLDPGRHGPGGGPSADPPPTRPPWRSRSAHPPAAALLHRPRVLGRRLRRGLGACLVAWAAALPVVALGPGPVLARSSRAGPRPGTRWRSAC